jgi:hypothetical protein
LEHSIRVSHTAFLPEDEPNAFPESGATAKPLSLVTDIRISLLKDLVIARLRLRIVIASATLDAEKMSPCFTNAPIMYVLEKLVDIQNSAAPLRAVRRLLGTRGAPVEDPCINDVPPIIRATFPSIEMIGATF